MWHWLAASWTAPQAASRDFVASTIVLTTEVVAKMTAFWNRFRQVPESIRTTARQAHQQPFFIAVGPDRVSLTMVAMPALAAQYPSVVAALKAAGLTAEQPDAYRLALISTSVARQAGKLDSTLAPTSVLGENIAFMKAHRNAFKLLGATGMWCTP